MILCLFLFFAGTVLAISGQELAEKIKNVTENLIKVGVILAFLSLVLGGFLYITSSGNVARIESAKKQIFGSFFGLIILFSGWFLLTKIRPEFIIVNPEEITFPNAPLESLEKPQGMYLVSAEVPIETYLKGLRHGDFDNSFLLNRNELREIFGLLRALKQTEPDEGPGLLDILMEDTRKLVDLMKRCHCRYTEPVNITSNCEWAGTEEEPECVGDCEAEKCCGDPCRFIRTSQMVPLINKNISNNVSALSVRTELEKKIHWLSKALATVYYALGYLENCPHHLAFNREYFSQIKDYLDKTGINLQWVISRVSFLDEIAKLRIWAFADFYCPKTGVFPQLPDPQEVEGLARDFFVLLESASSADPRSVEEFNKLEEEFKKLESKLEPEFTAPLSCPVSIPFGEALEKILKKPVELRRLLREIIDLLVDFVKKVIEIHQYSFLCSAKGCRPECRCDYNCDCECECLGQPCPLDEAEWALSELENIYSKLSQRIKEAKDIIKEIFQWLDDWPKIESEVRKREKSLTIQGIKSLYDQFPKSKEIVAFEIVSAKMHYCVAETKDIESNWGITSCYLSLRCLDPDNQIIENPRDCMCQKSKECQVNTPLMRYSCNYLKTANLGWLGQIMVGLETPITQECYYFNYFCCRNK